MLKPLNNHCKIEIMDDYAGIVRDKADEQTHKGVLRDFALSSQHLTTSTGHAIDLSFIDVMEGELNSWLGKVVYYGEYADTGQVIKEDGKQYAIVPWYRLIGVEE